MQLTTEKCLNVIGYAKGSATENYSGQETMADCQETEINEAFLEEQNNNKQKLAHFDFDFSDKVVLDVNCKTGGMLHELAGTIKHGVGVDSDPRNINAANLIAAVNKMDNIKFFTFDLQKENAYKLWNFIPGDRVDVCLCLGMRRGGGNWEKLIQFCVKISDNLLFEISGYAANLKNCSLGYIESQYASVKVLSVSSGVHSTDRGRVIVWFSNTPFCFHDAIQELARTADEPMEIKGIEPLDSSGCQRKTYRIRSEGRDYFLGVGGERNGADYAVSKYLRKNEIAAIDTIIASEDRCGTPYIIREYVKFTTLKKYEKADNVIEDVLNRICEIHNIKVRGYGFIGKASSDTDINGDWKSWLDFLQFLVNNEGSFLKNNSVISKEDYWQMISNYRLYFRKYKQFFETTGCLLLGDIGWSNILIGNQGKVFFTDFEFSLVGDPAFDFSCMFDYQRRHLDFYIKKRKEKDLSFNGEGFRRRVQIYEPIKMLLVASYASARNKRYRIAKYQYDDSTRRLNRLVHGRVKSFAWEVSSRLKRRLFP